MSYRLFVDDIRDRYRCNTSARYTQVIENESQKQNCIQVRIHTTCACTGG